MVFIMGKHDVDTTVHLRLARNLRRDVKRLAVETDSTIRESARRALVHYLERSDCREADEVRK